MRLTTYLLLFSILAFSSPFVSAQKQSPEATAFAHLKAAPAELGLTPEDVAELRVSDSYLSNGVQHVYVQQFYRGVPVQNGIAGYHFKGDKLLHHTSSFQTGFAEQQPAYTPQISSQDALLAAVGALSITPRQAPVRTKQEGNKSTYSWAGVSDEPITSALYYLEVEGALKLTWRVFIIQANTPDMWVSHIDALTGEELRRTNKTIYCDFHGKVHNESELGLGHQTVKTQSSNHSPSFPTHLSLLAQATTEDGSLYQVFPFGTESPLHGPREIRTEPADPEASPFGWHDVDGNAGAEFTITRGNNVHAYPDRSSSNAPDTDVIVDGGSDLQFDFFYEDFGDLDSILPAATAQLFYMNNMIHDFAWHHGFDEASGNFQQNNYGNGGQGGDAVRAEAQDGSGTNNANFGTPDDGGAPRMQMYIWTGSGPSIISIDEPSTLAGTFNTGSANYGLQTWDEPITASVAVALDNSDDPLGVCEDVSNPDEVAGKIALIRRGGCFFEQKTLNAQAAGAVAVIICNPENTLLTMAGGVDGDDPTIPSKLIEEFRCQEIRTAIDNGEDVVITFPAQSIPPPIDGDFDNGIVAHEYGHGISNRLVGGPSNTGCLGNNEQMGEGWSDFFALATSPLNNAATFPTGGEPRGIGNFALNAGINGTGIRRLPYSNDFAVNDYTYDDIITSGVPHPLGEIWSTVLWDLYWAMVDEYTFDSNLVSGSGGNNLAVELVIEGMKSTSCQPGLLDGRDGILAADRLINDGANQFLIWEVFARRGMGFSATQGSSNSTTDGVQAFDIDPAVIPTIKLAKATNVDLIDQGENFIVTLQIRNDKLEAATNITVTDELPDGLTVIQSSIVGAEAFSIESGSIEFSLSSLAAGEATAITYEVMTNDNHSVTQFFNGIENEEEGWFISPLNGQGVDLWQVVFNNVFEDNAALFVQNTENNNDQVAALQDVIVLSGDQPGLRFYTQYNTQPKRDAGLVEFSLDGGTSWQNVGNERILRGAYRGEVAPAAFSSSPTDFNSYWGPGLGYRDVLVDFSDLVGEEIQVRWRFGSNASEAVNNGGWWIDNVEFMDVFRYNGMASLITAEGDTDTAFGQAGGVLVESTLISDVEENTAATTQFRVYPNPANGVINVNVSGTNGPQVAAQLLSLDGRELARQTLIPNGDGVTTRFATDRLAAGIYFVRVTGTDRIYTKKVIVR